MSNFLLNLCLLTVLINITTAFYKPGDGTFELTAENFNRTVVASNQLWYVEFFVLRCGKCETFAPEYIKIANALKNIALFGVVNADVQSALGDAYGIEYYPIIKIFGKNKHAPVQYEGEHNAQAIFNDVMSRLGFKL
jgi:protein disulfide-isomerase A6